MNSKSWSLAHLTPDYQRDRQRRGDLRQLEMRVQDAGAFDANV